MQCRSLADSQDPASFSRGDTADIGSTVCPYLNIQDRVSAQLCIFLELSSNTPCYVVLMCLPDFPIIVTPPAQGVSNPSLLTAVITPFAEAYRPAGQALQIPILMPIWAKIWPSPSGPRRHHQCGANKAKYIHVFPPSSGARAEMLGTLRSSGRNAQRVQIQVQRLRQRLRQGQREKQRDCINTCVTFWRQRTCAESNVTASAFVSASASASAPASVESRE